MSGPDVAARRQAIAGAVLRRLARPGGWRSAAVRSVLAYFVTAVVDGQEIPAHEVLAAELGLSRRRLGECLRELEELDFVWMRQNGRAPARYVVMWDQLEEWTAQRAQDCSRLAETAFDVRNRPVEDGFGVAETAFDVRNRPVEDGSASRASASPSSSSSSSPASSAPSPTVDDDPLPPTPDWVKAMCLQDHGHKLAWTKGEIRDDIAARIADGHSRGDWRRAAGKAVKAEKPKAFMLACLDELKRERLERMCLTELDTAGIARLQDYARPWTGAGGGGQ